MQNKTIPLAQIDQNDGQIEGLPMNPRLWSLKKLEKLAKSIQRTPELMDARPPIVVEYDGRYVTIGGNMRVTACKRLEMESIVCTIIAADEFPVSKLKEIAIKDNSSFGQWDTDALANEWSEYDLTDFGLPDFAPDPVPSGDLPAAPVDDRAVVEITFGPNEFIFVTAALRDIDPSPEAAVLKLLGYGC